MRRLVIVKDLNKQVDSSLMEKFNKLFDEIQVMDLNTAEAVKFWILNREKCLAKWDAIDDETYVRNLCMVHFILKKLARLGIGWIDYNTDSEEYFKIKRGTFLYFDLGLGLDKEVRYGIKNSRFVLNEYVDPANEEVINELERKYNWRK